jgi:hypothetical protein
MEAQIVGAGLPSNKSGNGTVKDLAEYTCPSSFLPCTFGLWNNCVVIENSKPPLSQSVRKRWGVSLPGLLILN